MTTETKIQTAANNADLARVKAAMNAPIYRTVRLTYNAAGRDAARAYLGQFFNDEARARVLDGFFPPA